MIKPSRIDACTDDLAHHGFGTISDIDDEETLSAVLRSFGSLMPQYDSRLTHEVRAVDGFEHLSYSKSQNEIRAHTEAPGWDPPPRYLALFCRRQATCGGGHTDLLDGRAFLRRYKGEDEETLRSREIVFPRPQARDSGREASAVRRPVIETDTSGRDIVRFSFNLFTYGAYEPRIGALVDEGALPLGAFGKRLAAEAVDVFSRDRTALLISERSLLIWDNQRMFHARSAYVDRNRHLTRFWIT